MRVRILILVGLVVLTAGLLAGCAGQTGGEEKVTTTTTVTAEEKKEIKAAFVYVSPVGDAGWTYAHDQGRQFIEKKYGIKTAYTENVAEGGDDERVIREYAEQGYDVIFTTSFGFMDATITVARISRIQFSCTAVVTRLLKMLGRISAGCIRPVTSQD